MYTKRNQYYSFTAMLPSLCYLILLASHFGTDYVEVNLSLSLPISLSLSLDLICLIKICFTLPT